MLLFSIVPTNILNQNEVSAVGKQPIKNLDPNNILTGSYVDCIDDKKWWLGVVLEKCLKRGDV